MADQDIVRLHAIVEGRVQGVGFRAFVLDRAGALGLTGWVRNTGSGQVEVTAEGPRPELQMLLEYLRQGPRSAFISSVQQEWQPATREFLDFNVSRTSW
jgi:acylphosphatase